MRLRDHGAWPTLSHMSHFLSRIFISHLTFLSRISHFYFASRIFISHIAFLSRISHFYLASRIFYLASRIFISHLAFLSRISHFLSRIYLQNFFFLFLIKSHLECPWQASVGLSFLWWHHSKIRHITMITIGLMSDPSIKSLNSLKVQTGPASSVL